MGCDGLSYGGIGWNELAYDGLCSCGLGCDGLGYNGLNWVVTGGPMVGLAVIVSAMVGCFDMALAVILARF